MEKIRSIAIDGPAGAGKSTIAKKVAADLGFIYVDTGAMYRAMALYLTRNDVDMNDADAIGRCCRNADISIEYRGGEQIVLLAGENVNPYLRTEEVSRMASISSANSAVRAKLVELQQQLARRTPVVMDGRDIGTVVLKNAILKIFLTASVEVRAGRRADEQAARGETVDIKEIEADIADRDRRDMTRAISPLKQADDAILVDSSCMTIEEVKDHILTLYNIAISGNMITAKSAGFCFGVQKAIDAVYKEAENGTPIYTYGPIIHNENVVEDLRKRGVGIVESSEEVQQLAKQCRNDGTKATVIIRSHGVSEAIMKEIRDSGLAIVDATCPFVARIHRIVEEESEKGSQIIIIGNVGHAEVVGTCGWSCTPASVIETEEEARNWAGNKEKPVTIVAQTTFNSFKFNELVAILKNRGYNINVVNTICNATRQRQEEAKTIASVSDVMIVIGGRNSSNSAKLYEICRKECDSTYFIQTVRDLPELGLSSVKVGITAGASTPKNIIEEVQNYVRTGRREF